MASIVGEVHSDVLGGTRKGGIIIVILRETVNLLLYKINQQVNYLVYGIKVELVIRWYLYG